MSFSCLSLATLALGEDPHVGLGVPFELGDQPDDRRLVRALYVGARGSTALAAEQLMAARRHEHRSGLRHVLPRAAQQPKPLEPPHPSVGLCHDTSNRRPIALGVTNLKRPTHATTSTSRHAPLDLPGAPTDQARIDLLISQPITSLGPPCLTLCLSLTLSLGHVSAGCRLGAPERFDG